MTSQSPLPSAAHDAAPRTPFRHSPFGRLLPRFLLALVGAALALWACQSTGTGSAPPQPVVPEHPGGVHGIVWAAKRGDVQDPGHARVALRDLELVLVDKATGIEVARERTDVYGSYDFPPVPLGTYRLTWPEQLGWAAGSYPDDLVVVRGSVHPDEIVVRPASGRIAVLGQVRFLDQSIPGVVEESFGVIDKPEVSLTTAGGAVVAGPVNSNYLASFALSVPTTDLASRHLRAEIAASTASAPLAAPSGGAITQDLVLSNHGPQVAAVHLTDGGGSTVQDAAGGQVLRSRAEVVDADGDPLDVQWQGAFGGVPGELVPVGAEADWTVPGGHGGHTIRALVHDGKGGYAIGRGHVAVGRTTEWFDGSVVDKQTGAALPDVEVEVNGVAVSTAPNGFYRLEVPLAARYVLNVRHPEYALAGNTFDRGKRGSLWRLVRRQEQVFDPGQGVTLVDDREVLQRDKRRGATVVIGPDSLEGPGGAAPAGPLTASFATLDIGDDEAVGDWAGRRAAGDVGLVSYGVVSLEIRDAAGVEYQLRAGETAELRVPISGVPAGTVPAGAPNQLPVWSYDEGDGYWKISGQATLDAASSTYVGQVTHLSEINMDQEGEVSCIRIVTDPGLIGRTFRVSDVAGDGVDYDTVKENELDQPLNAIYRVPANQKVQVDVLTGPGGSVLPNVVIERFDSANPSGGWVALPDNQVLAGPGVAELWPEYPYDACPITITLKWQEPETDYFLHNKGIGDATAAAEYYEQVNPQAGGAGNRDTLEDWWAHNGFDASGEVTPTGTELYARTSYVNGNDLGSGRDMHLYRREDGTVAAWVSNYGNFDQNHSNATLALFQNNLGNVVATVCMEYSPMEDAGGQFLDDTGAVFVEGDFAITADYLDAVREASVVKFFVYADRDGVPGAELWDRADLDGRGDKFVPNLCCNCHGGSPQLTYGQPSDADIGAFFRELDYETYDFPLSASDPSLTEQESFRIQNDIVRATDADLISSPGIKELIDIWYRGGASDVVQDDSRTDPGSGNVVAASIPSGWDTNEVDRRFYADVVGRSCRTCHLAFEDLDFTDAATFADGGYLESRVDQFVNDTPASGTMPHAAITFRNLWVSEDPHRPDAARDFIDNN